MIQQPLSTLYTYESASPVCCDRPHRVVYMSPWSPQEQIILLRSIPSVCQRSISYGWVPAKSPMTYTPLPKEGLATHLTQSSLYRFRSRQFLFLILNRGLKALIFLTDLGCKDRDKPLPSRSLCVMASTQSILTRNVNLSRKSRKVGAWLSNHVGRLLWYLQQPPNVGVYQCPKHIGMGLSTQRMPMMDYWVQNKLGCPWQIFRPITEIIAFLDRPIDNEIGWRWVHGT